MSVGQRVKDARIKNGWSQAELAAKLGYKDKTAISRIENGDNELNQTKLVKFSDVLGVTPAYLMGWDNCITDYYVEAELKSLNSEDKKKVAFIVDLIKKQPDRADALFSLIGYEESENDKKET